MKSKTLKEIAAQYAEALGAANPEVRQAITEVVIRKACLEYAKSIVPPIKPMHPFDEGINGFNSCSSQILYHLSKEEELLNK